MDVGWLETFVEVARRGSLTAAARTLGYTAPAVSRQIAALEDTIGARLFDRAARGVRPTAAGRALLAHAEAVLARWELARRELDSLRDPVPGRLRVGTFDSADAVLVPRAVGQFRTTHPRVIVDVTEGGTAPQLARLSAGDIEVAVIAAYEHQALDADRYRLEFLGDDPLMVALPLGHRLAGTGTLALADLDGEDWIEDVPDGAVALLAACQRAGFRPRIELTATEWTARLGFVAAGLGVALVPSIAVNATRPDIVVVPLRPDEAPVRRLYAATPRGAPTPSTVAAFLRCLNPDATAPRPAVTGGAGSPGRAGSPGGAAGYRDGSRGSRAAYQRAAILS